MQVHSWFLFWVFIGIFFIAFLAVLLAKMREKRDYDERQLIEQGKAGKLAFWVMVFGLILYYVFAQISRLRFAEEGVVGVFIALAGVLVFGLYSLLRDAYFVRGKSPVPLISWFAVYGLLQTGTGIHNAFSGMLVSNGLLTYHAASLALGAVFLILAAAMLIKALTGRRESGE